MALINTGLGNGGTTVHIGNVMSFGLETKYTHTLRIASRCESENLPLVNTYFYFIFKYDLIRISPKTVARIV